MGMRFIFEVMVKNIVETSSLWVIQSVSILGFGVRSTHTHTHTMAADYDLFCPTA